MSKYLIPFIIFSFSFVNSIGQKKDLILTNAQSIRWFDSLKVQPLNVQLKMISEKIILDTSICLSEYQQSDRILTEMGTTAKPIMCVSAFPSEFYRFPLLVINQNIIISIRNNTNKQKILSLSKLLTTENIKAITIFEGPASSALFGIDGSNGAILFVLSKKNKAGRFKKLKISQN